MDAAEVFRALAGDWRLTRTIPGQGAMAGMARFREAGPEELRYREEGRLTLTSGVTVTAHREYRYVLEPGAIRVLLVPAGDTLHVLHPAPASGAGVLTASDIHLCGDDAYAGEYRFVGSDRIVIRMRVRGPRKDYAIVTLLDRVGEPGRQGR
jgi:hypothetical protein